MERRGSNERDFVISIPRALYLPHWYESRLKLRVMVKLLYVPLTKITL